MRNFDHMGEESLFEHLIDGDGNFNGHAKESLEKSLSHCGSSYGVISIIGPQSSGKSTLLNQLFGTKFEQMDASRGRGQTTKGIWLAKALNIEPAILVIDVEGTDGKERGTADTSFEKQSALFALAVSDIVCINMWCHDIGLENAANRPLIKIVFNVMLQHKLFGRGHKITILFIIRDRDETPFDKLDEYLRNDMQEVEVVCLPSLRTEKEEFQKQVASLREHLQNSINSGGLAVPASGFSSCAQKVWEVIKECKYLINLRAVEEWVATTKCDEVAENICKGFSSNKDWQDIQNGAQHEAIPGFAEKINIILDGCLQKYDMETRDYVDGIRTEKRQSLLRKLSQLVNPAYQSILAHIRRRMLNGFKGRFHAALTKNDFAQAAKDCSNATLDLFRKEAQDAAPKQVECDASQHCSELEKEVEAEISAVRKKKLAELSAADQGQLKDALVKSLEHLINTEMDFTWNEGRVIFRQEMEHAQLRLLKSLRQYEIDVEGEQNMLLELENHGRNAVKETVKAEANEVLIHMMKRARTIFSVNSNGTPNETATKDAFFQAFKMLGFMVAFQLYENYDIWKPLDDVLKQKSSASLPPSNKWEMVPAENTVLGPHQCFHYWMEFTQEFKGHINSGKLSLEISEEKRKGNLVRKEKFKYAAKKSGAYLVTGVAGFTAGAASVIVPPVAPAAIAWTIAVAQAAEESVEEYKRVRDAKIKQIEASSSTSQSIEKHKRKQNAKIERIKAKASSSSKWITKLESEVDAAIEQTDSEPSSSSSRQWITESESEVDAAIEETEDPEPSSSTDDWAF